MPSLLGDSATDAEAPRLRPSRKNACKASFAVGSRRPSVAASNGWGSSARRPLRRRFVGPGERRVSRIGQTVLETWRWR
jgi:hypothetical protein